MFSWKQVSKAFNATDLPIHTSENITSESAGFTRGYYTNNTKFRSGMA